MMRELSMHIMDITQNSVRADARNVEVRVCEDLRANKLSFSVSDDGCGMSPELVEKVRDPFTTSRTTRKVGLGIPMLEQTCLQCGGFLEISSQVGLGTAIKAQMDYDNIDRPPLGDMANTIHVLAIMNPDINLKYIHQYISASGQGREYCLDMAEVKEVLDGLPLDEPSVMEWIKGNIEEGLNGLNIEVPYNSQKENTDTAYAGS
ncbi:MAG: ATP-binding protein [Clostridiales bacterium]|jgi:hypothetical protein|nr:ATP-binding protein [Clostridiales bacterium]